MVGEALMGTETTTMVLVGLDFFLVGEEEIAQINNTRNSLSDNVNCSLYDCYP